MNTIRQIKPHLICLVTAAFLFLILTGCSTPSISEEDIRADLENCFQNDYPYLAFDSITVSIDQRQTNEDDKTDYIWASISATNSDIQYTGSYSAEYILYNDGWAMDSYNETDGHFSLLRSNLTEDNALEAVYSVYPSIYDTLEFE